MQNNPIVNQRHQIDSHRIKDDQHRVSDPLAGLSEWVEEVHGDEAEDRGIAAERIKQAYSTHSRTLDLSELNLSTLPDAIGNLTEVEELNLDGVPIESLPDSIENLHKLQKLEISGAQFTQLPDSIGNLVSLQRLTISLASKLELLPENIGKLSHLQELEISGAQFTQLPDSIGNLVSLQRLTISMAPNLESLPENIGKLSNLQQLDLSYNDVLHSLPESLSNLQNLKVLDLSDSGITKLSDGIRQLPGLSHLVLPDALLEPVNNNISISIQTTDTVATLREALKQWVNQGVAEDRAIAAERIVDAYKNNSRELNLFGINITSLPDVIQELSNLEILNLSASGLKALPDCVGQLSQLKRLYLSNTSVAVIPDSFKKLDRLQFFTHLNTPITQRPENFERFFTASLKFNGKVAIENGKAVCRHYAAANVLAGNIKSNIEHFKDEDSIRSHLLSNKVNDASYRELPKYASNVYLYDADHVGECFTNEYHTMSPGETRSMLLASRTHAMNIELHVKQKLPDPPYYNIRFYDPNNTSKYHDERCASLDDVSKLSLSFFLRKKNYDHYFPPHLGEALMLYAFSSKEKIDLTTTTSSEPTWIIDPALSPSPYALHLLLNNGLDSEINTLKQRVSKAGLAIDQLIPLFTAEGLNGRSGLYFALSKGHGDAIRAYGNLIKDAGLTATQYFELLRAPDSRGAPGFYFALRNGHVDAILAYGHLINQAGLSLEQYETLLTAINSKGTAEDSEGTAKDNESTAGLAKALLNGHAKAIEAFEELLSDLGVMLFPKLEEACRKEISQAKKNGHTEAIKAFERLSENRGVG